MAKHQVLAFGDYRLEIATAPTKRDRDIKTQFVNMETGENVRADGATRGAQPRVAEGLARCANVGGQWVELPQETLNAIAEGSKAAHEEMRVLETISITAVPLERVLGSKWVLPRGGTGKGLAILARALYDARLVAVVKWVDTSREKLGVLRSVHRGTALLLTEVSFANDFAPAPDEALLDGIATEAPEVAAGTKLVRAFRRPVKGERKLDSASDTAVDARRELLASLAPDFAEQIEAELAEERDREVVLA